MDRRRKSERFVGRMYSEAKKRYDNRANGLEPPVKYTSLKTAIKVLG